MLKLNQHDLPVSIRALVPINDFIAVHERQENDVHSDLYSRKKTRVLQMLT